MRVLFFCLILFQTNCSKKTVLSDFDTSSSKSLNTLLETEVGKKYEQLFNESNSLLLAIRDKETSATQTNYIVVDIATLTIIKKGTFVPGYIKWKDKAALELLDAPGNLPQGKNLSDYTKIIQLSVQNQ